WWYAVRTGARLDRENAARDAAQAQWEREHPDG
ncbi:membrane protein, partial [Kocuria sp. SM24M-10]